MSGYSKNLITLERMLPFLGPVIEGRLCRWETPYGEADRFAYKVREAFAISLLHRPWLAALSLQTGTLEDTSKYEKMELVARHSEKFRVVVVSPSIVQTQLAKGRTEAQVLTEGAPINGLEEAGRSVVTVGLQTVATVITAWERSQPSNTPLHFPSAQLSYEELLELFRWTEEMHLMMFEVDGALTLQKRSKDLEGFAWAPKDFGGSDEPEIPFPFPED